MAIVKVTDADFDSKVESGTISRFWQHGVHVKMIARY